MIFHNLPKAGKTVSFALNIESNVCTYNCIYKAEFSIFNYDLSKLVYVIYTSIQKIKRTNMGV